MMFQDDTRMNCLETAEMAAPLSFQQVLGLGSSSSQQRNSVWASTGGPFQIGSCISMYQLHLIHGGFLSHRGTPSHHPFRDGIFHSWATPICGNPHVFGKVSYGVSYIFFHRFDNL